MNKNFKKTLKNLSLLLGIAYCGISSAEEQVQGEFSKIEIREVGSLDPKLLKKAYSPYFVEERSMGKEATRTLRESFAQKDLMGKFMVKPLHIKGYVRIHADKEGSYDTGGVMISDIQKDKLIISKHYATEEQMSATKRDPLKMDGAIIHQGSKLADSLGANAGIWGGIGINVISNLAVNLFSGSKSKTEFSKANTGVTAETCGADCAITHHEVVLTMLYDSDPKANFTIVLDKVDSKVDATNLGPLANLGLELMAQRLKNAIYPTANANVDTKAETSTAPASDTTDDKK